MLLQLTKIHHQIYHLHLHPFNIKIIYDLPQQSHPLQLYPMNKDPQLHCQLHDNNLHMLHIPIQAELNKKLDNNRNSNPIHNYNPIRSILPIPILSILGNKNSMDDHSNNQKLRKTDRYDIMDALKANLFYNNL